MKGRIVKKIDSLDWVVWFNKPNNEGVGILPLHPKDVEQINEWSQVFDNIEGRISSDNEVEFEIIATIPQDLKPTNGETLSFTAIKYAKLIYTT